MLQTRRSIDGGVGWGGVVEKKARKSIDQRIDCLAGSQVCISQVTHAQAGCFPGGYSHCKVLLSMTEGTGSRDKGNKDPSRGPASPGSLLVLWQDEFSKLILIAAGLMPFHGLHFNASS